jgi:hypothetical protein
MQRADNDRLGLAQARFIPVAQVLNGIVRDIEREHGRSVVLTPRDAMHKLAENAYTVRYSLQQPEDVRLSLTFTLVGENADLLLVQGQERSSSGDFRANPGQVDQHVYRLEQIDEIKLTIRDKILAHLRSRY